LNEFFLSELKKYQILIEREINSFFIKKEKEFSMHSIESKKLVSDMKEFTLRPGKRIRPILVLMGFKAVKGKIDLKAVKAACALELLQSYLLIHDDVMDESPTRRGKTAFHKIYEQKMKKNKFIKASRFGESTAIIAGDLMHSLAVEILLECGMEKEFLFKAVKKLMEINKLTAVGQQLDLMLESKKSFTKKDVLKVQEYKTAKYTIEGPLQLGAILAGADENQLKQLSDYAVSIGIAFQIHDDILGVFGSKETGKSSSSDLIEGKKTLLVLKALEKGNLKQKKALNAVLGNKNASETELNEARKISKEENVPRTDCLLAVMSKKLNAPIISRDFHLKEIEAETFTP